MQRCFRPDTLSDARRRSGRTRGAEVPLLHAIRGSSSGVAGWCSGLAGMRQPCMPKHRVVSATPGLVDVLLTVKRSRRTGSVRVQSVGDAFTLSAVSADASNGLLASRLTRAVKTVGSRVAAGTIRDRTAG